MANLLDWLRCICGNNKYKKEIITNKQYFMGRDEQYKTELTDQIKENAQILLNKVNQLLTELNIDIVEVSSGWRPAAINNTIQNASKKSAHMEGKAVDIKDIDHKLYDLILSRNDLLKKYGLWMEDKESTKNWVHLDYKERSDRPIRVFKP